MQRHCAMLCILGFLVFDSGVRVRGMIGCCFVVGGCDVLIL